MQKINLIAQSVLELSHCENADDDDNDNDNDDDDTHPGWIMVRVGMYSVADKNHVYCVFRLKIKWATFFLLVLQYIETLERFVTMRRFINIKQK